MRNDRAFHAGLEKIDKFSIDNVNTGENEFFRRAAAEQIVNVEDTAAAWVEGDVFRPGFRSQREGDDVVFSKVIVDQASNRQIGENIAVVNQERLVP